MDSNDPLDWENWTGELPFWQHALCGSIAGVMEHISLFPLDTIKTRLQTDSSNTRRSAQTPSSASIFNKATDFSTNGLKSASKAARGLNGINSVHNQMDASTINVVKQPLGNMVDSAANVAMNNPNRMDSMMTRDYVGKIIEKLNIRSNKPIHKIVANRSIATEALATPMGSIAGGLGSRSIPESVVGPASTVSAPSSSATASNPLKSSTPLKTPRSTLSHSNPAVSIPKPTISIPSRNITPRFLRHIEPVAPSSGFYSNLFRGSNVIIAGCVPAHVLYFTVYEKIKSAGSIAASGAAATFCHDLVLTPADVIKQRLQLGCYRNTSDCVYNVLRHEGVRALFRSFHITLLMNVPYHSLLVSIMHLLKRTSSRPNTTDSAPTGLNPPSGSTHFNSSGSSKLEGSIGAHSDSGSSKEIDSYKHFLFAGIGGAVAGALTTPLDVIKTRLQTQTCQMDTKRPKLQIKYKNVMATFENIYRKEGLRGFMRGVTTRIGMCTPSAAISWGTYESLKSLIKLIE